MKITKTKLKQIIKEELQKIVEIEDPFSTIMNKIMGMTPGSDDIKAELLRLAGAARSDVTSAEVLKALKDQYARKEPVGVKAYPEMAMAVFNNMTAGRGKGDPWT